VLKGAGADVLNSNIQKLHQTQGSGAGWNSSNVLPPQR
jgi:hypothetical protein